MDQLRRYRWEVELVWFHGRRSRALASSWYGFMVLMPLTVRSSARPNCKMRKKGGCKSDVSRMCGELMIVWLRDAILLAADRLAPCTECRVPVPVNVIPEIPPLLVHMHAYLVQLQHVGCL